MLTQCAKKMKQAVSEMQSYTDVAQEISRNYIQLVNRDSEIVSNQALHKLKEHLKRLDTTITNQTELYNTMFEVASAYSDYSDTLRDLSKTWDQLIDKQKSWRDADYELKKAQAKNNYEKYDKIESNVRKGKNEVIKAFNEKEGKDSFVSSAMVRVNQAWNLLKIRIKNISW
jgi:predicted nuclease with TOPRIM domain